MSAAKLHEVTTRLASVLRSSVRRSATAHGLKLVQLEALVYLASANRYSDMLAAVADYLGVTKGTVSKTLDALAGRGLIEKLVDLEDARVVHCRPTPKGLALVADAVPTPALSELPKEEVEASTAALLSLLRAMQAARGFRTFGECRTCRHFQRGRSGGVCGLTTEPLTQADTRRICREHEAV